MLLPLTCFVRSLCSHDQAARQRAEEEQRRNDELRSLQKGLETEHEEFPPFAFVFVCVCVVAKLPFAFAIVAQWPFSLAHSMGDATMGGRQGSFGRVRAILLGQALGRFESRCSSWPEGLGVLWSLHLCRQFSPRRLLSLRKCASACNFRVRSTQAPLLVP